MLVKLSCASYTFPMGLLFSDDGPEFPAALVDDLVRGEVVFLCGAGVSAPQMPGFKGLVDDIYVRIGLDRTRGEQLSHNKERYEECLGSLARRLANPAALYDTVAIILKTPARPDFSNHRTLLRLSRQLDNRLTIVTTNFDTMFERAVRQQGRQQEGTTAARNLSIAGQSLPAPGTPAFAGIIHLHGRLEDRHLGLHRTPLVLTSAEYGDAYMRSGWASRFLFDLTRCRTVVLIGYRANDAPVRYFLNVLEADRDRFSDLRKVYALDGVDGSDRQLAHDAWSAVAVHPIPYCKRDEDARGGPHAALWDDLAQLADLVEKPKASRRTRAEAIFRQPFADSTAQDYATLNWAFQRSEDISDLAITTIQDPAWLDHLVEQKLLEGQHASRLLAAWCSRHWTEQAAINAGVSWSDRVGPSFGDALDFFCFRQLQGPPVPEPWHTAWRLLSLAANRLRRNTNLAAFELKNLFDHGKVLDHDRRRAVHLMAPVLLVEKPWRFNHAEKKDPPAQISDILRATMEVVDEIGVTELAPSLLDPEAAPRIAELAIEELRSSLHMATDAGLISARWDITDSDVPSVERHAQNAHHSGFLPLVRLIASLLDVIGATDVEQARKLAEDCGRLGSRVGRRLWLHSMRRRDLFRPDEAIAGLLALTEDDFWTIRRE
jgi:hypothetical protein